MKKLTALIVALIITMCLPMNASASAVNHTKEDLTKNTSTDTASLDLPVKSACLMEASTGQILYYQNKDENLPLASVTKIMTLLLVCESLEVGSFKLDDMVSVSAYAASMGGSQVFLEEGERMSVEELIKCTVIASANDAAVALAELVAGSESAFVRKMNEKAEELGMKNSHFENTTGLDDTVSSHYSSAQDIAIMSKELIKHEIILKYSGIWQDTIRNGEFTLTNTNRLVRYYEGCNGLKTGSTDKAGYCVSATAKKGNMQLIAVVMGADTRDERNNAAKSLLDYGFAEYVLYEKGEEFLEECELYQGRVQTVPLYSRSVSFIAKRSTVSSIQEFYEIPEYVTAPLSKGDAVGKIVYKLGEEILTESEIYVGEDAVEINLWDIFTKIIKRIIVG